MLMAPEMRGILLTLYQSGDSWWHGCLQTYWSLRQLVTLVHPVEALALRQGVHWVAHSIRLAWLARWLNCHMRSQAMLELGWHRCCQQTLLVPGVAWKCQRKLRTDCFQSWITQKLG